MKLPGCLGGVAHDNNAGVFSRWKFGPNLKNDGFGIRQLEKSRSSWDPNNRIIQILKKRFKDPGSRGTYCCEFSQNPVEREFTRNRNLKGWINSDISSKSWDKN